MANASTAPTALISPPARKLPAVAVIGAILAVIGGALTIPFLFESSTMYYKFGAAKIVLRSAKMVGLTAAVLLLVQLPLAGRLKWLDRIFSLPGLVSVHRINAQVIGVLVLVHPVLILSAEGKWSIPLEARYWPEWVGISLLTAVLLQIGFGRWRRRVFQAYENWRWIHGALAAGIFTGLFVHVLYVSETFENKGLPRMLVMAAAIGMGMLWAWIRTGRLRSGRKPFRVTRVEVAGLNAHTLDLEPEPQHRLNYLPGQFAFISFQSAHISKEFHPFTISSTPSRPGGIQFTIRCCGDWTNRIGAIQKGTRARLQGPYGCFSHLFFHADREIIMIAGGIGITPMLSMLRYMSDQNDQRRITLIWSNQTRAHLFGDHELKSMEKKLTGFKWVPIFTRESPNEGQFGRLDRSTLEVILGACGRDAAVFLCGPPPMVVQVRTDLKQIGFPRKSIYFEAFGF